MALVALIALVAIVGLLIYFSDEEKIIPPAVQAASATPTNTPAVATPVPRSPITLQPINCPQEVHVELGAAAQELVTRNIYLHPQGTNVFVTCQTGEAAYIIELPELKSRFMDVESGNFSIVWLLPYPTWVILAEPNTTLVLEWSHEGAVQDLKKLALALAAYFNDNRPRTLEYAKSKLLTVPLTDDICLLEGNIYFRLANQNPAIDPSYQIAAMDNHEGHFADLKQAVEKYTCGTEKASEVTNARLANNLQIALYELWNNWDESVGGRYGLENLGNYQYTFAPVNYATTFLYNYGYPDDKSVILPAHQVGMDEPTCGSSKRFVLSQICLANAAYNKGRHRDTRLFIEMKEALEDAERYEPVGPESALYEYYRGLAALCVDGNVEQAARHFLNTKAAVEAQVYYDEVFMNEINFLLVSKSQGCE